MLTGTRDSQLVPPTAHQAGSTDADEPATVDLLLAELDGALSMTDHAAHADSDQARLNCYESAGQAYRAVWHYVDKLTPSAVQKLEIDRRVLKLKERLANAGVRFV